MPPKVVVKYQKSGQNVAYKLRRKYVVTWLVFLYKKISFSVTFCTFCVIDLFTHCAWDYFQLIFFFICYYKNMKKVFQIFISSTSNEPIIKIDNSIKNLPKFHADDKIPTFTSLTEIRIISKKFIAWKTIISHNQFLNKRFICNL